MHTVLTHQVVCRPFCKSNFTIGFFVPPAEDPPQPSNPDIRIVDFPKQTFYVLQVR